MNYKPFTQCTSSQSGHLLEQVSLLHGSLWTLTNLMLLDNELHSWIPLYWIQRRRLVIYALVTPATPLRPRDFRATPNNRSREAARSAVASPLNHEQWRNDADRRRGPAAAAFGPKPILPAVLSGGSRLHERTLQRALYVILCLCITCGRCCVCDGRWHRWWSAALSFLWHRKCSATVYFRTTYRVRRILRTFCVFDQIYVGWVTCMGQQSSYD